MITEESLTQFVLTSLICTLNTHEKIECFMFVLMGNSVSCGESVCFLDFTGQMTPIKKELLNMDWAAGTICFLLSISIDFPGKC